MDLNEANQAWLDQVTDLAKTEPLAAAAVLQTKYDELEASLENHNGKWGRCSCGALNKKHRKSNGVVCTRGKAGCLGTHSTYYIRYGHTVADKVSRKKALKSECKRQIIFCFPVPSQTNYASWLSDPEAYEPKEMPEKD